MDNQKSYADILRVEGVNAKGYGIVPKLIMKDKRLTPTAKLIYAYFCSYCGAGDRQAFPRRGTIISDLGISKDTFYKHFNILKKHDYIRVKQKTQNGRFLYNIYTLVQCPDDSKRPKNRTTKGKLPCPKSSDTELSDTELSDTVFSDTELSDTVNSDTNNNNRIGNNNILPTFHECKGEHKDKPKDGRRDDIQKELREKYNYDLLADEGNTKLFDSIITLIADVLCGSADSYRIGGVDIDADTVKQRFLELDDSDISYLRITLETADNIRNPRNYLLTALFNARTGSELFWKSEISEVTRRYNELHKNDFPVHTEKAADLGNDSYMPPP